MIRDLQSYSSGLQKQRPDISGDREVLIDAPSLRRPLKVRNLRLASCQTADLLLL